MAASFCACGVSSPCRCAQTALKRSPRSLTQSQYIEPGTFHYMVVLEVGRCTLLLHCQSTTMMRKSLGKARPPRNGPMRGCCTTRSAQTLIA